MLVGILAKAEFVLSWSSERAEVELRAIPDASRLLGIKIFPVENARQRPFKLNQICKRIRSGTPITLKRVFMLNTFGSLCMRELS